MKRIQGSSADTAMASQGLKAAREKALEAFKDAIPPHLLLGYAFSKQDAYKLRKIGLVFQTDESMSATPEHAMRVNGNSLPEATAVRGTRLCVGGDKVMQVLSQACTWNLKRTAKSIPSAITEPAAFLALEIEIVLLEAKRSVEILIVLSIVRPMD